MTDLPPELAFARGGLYVAYRASSAPQLVDVLVELHAPDPKRRVPMLVQRLVDDVNTGAGGGAEFSPAACGARAVAGLPPTIHAVPGAEGPTYRYTLEVASVSPLFWRHAVEVLAMRGNVRMISIRGALPLDDSPLSARQADVEAWMRQPRTHLGRFVVPFPVRAMPRSSGTACVRAALVDAVSQDHLLAFDESLLVFGNCLRTYGGPTGVGRARVATQPGAGRGAHVLAAMWDEFACEGEPARDLLLNVMGAYHARVAPIARLDMGIPG